ncbi:MAG TPA: TraR/DksA C4-type zinc finger protein [Burkholderiales bacterium]|jgi:RNA polymerase-binding transcription factor DksA|nr:TraR/DksA C4-type zinc finger protein [Burkholderiales bacterium]
MALTAENREILQAMLERRRAALAVEYAARSDELQCSRLLAELRRIGVALARCADGRHGRCADCELDIDFERLLADPVASRCARCQGRHEKVSAVHRKHSAGLEAVA